MDQGHKKLRSVHGPNILRNTISCHPVTGAYPPQLSHPLYFKKERTPQVTWLGMTNNAFTVLLAGAEGRHAYRLVLLCLRPCCFWFLLSLHLRGSPITMFQMTCLCSQTPFVHNRGSFYPPPPHNAMVLRSHWR